MTKHRGGRRKISDIRSVLDAIRDSGLTTMYMSDGHIGVYDGKKFVGKLSGKEGQGTHTLLNYVREIKNRCGVDIRTGKRG